MPLLSPLCLYFGLHYALKSFLWKEEKLELELRNIYCNKIRLFIISFYSYKFIYFMGKSFLWNYLMRTMNVLHSDGVHTVSYDRDAIKYQ